MLDVLARLFDDAGRLVGVTHSEFDDDARIVVAVMLSFEFLTVEFRADADTDTLVIDLQPNESEPGESRVEVGEVPP
jgi:hypothetical protein